MFKHLKSIGIVLVLLIIAIISIYVNTTSDACDTGYCTVPSGTLTSVLK